MDCLGIEHQTVFGLPPVEFVNLAADLGCHYIAIAPIGGGYNPHGYDEYSLIEDAALRRRTITALKDRDVSISLGEGIIVHPGSDVRAGLPLLDVFAELGVTRINTVTMDPDLPRSYAEFALLTEQAAERGIETTVEFAPSLTLRNLDDALAAVHQIDRPDFRLLIDTMHVARAGHTASDLAAIDPTLIAYIQLSDNSAEQRGAVYRDDTIDRMAPGDGELPLRDLLRALPSDVVIGLEVPMRSRAEAGESTPDRARRCVAGARALLASL